MAQTKPNYIKVNTSKEVIAWTIAENGVSRQSKHSTVFCYFCCKESKQDKLTRHCETIHEQPGRALKYGEQPEMPMFINWELYTQNWGSVAPIQDHSAKANLREKKRARKGLQALPKQLSSDENQEQLLHKPKFQKQAKEISDLKVIQRKVLKDQYMAIKKKYSVKEVAVQTDIKIGSSKIKARVMEMLCKRGAPNPGLPKEIKNDKDITKAMLRSMLNNQVKKRKEFKGLWKDSKDDLEKEIKKNKEQAEKLNDVSNKKKQYHKMYRSEKQVAEEMSIMYEDIKAKMNNTLQGKEGWIPIADFNQMKTQLQESLKKATSSEQQLQAMNTMFLRKQTQVVYSEKEALDSKQEVERQRKHIELLEKNLRETQTFTTESNQRFNVVHAKAKESVEMADKKAQLLEKEKTNLFAKVQSQNSTIDDLNAQLEEFQDRHYVNYNEQCKKLGLERRIGYLEQDKKNLHARVNDLLKKLDAATSKERRPQSSGKVTMGAEFGQEHINGLFAKSTCAFKSEKITEQK